LALVHGKPGLQQSNLQSEKVVQPKQRREDGHHRSNTAVRSAHLKAADGEMGKTLNTAVSRENLALQLL